MPASDPDREREYSLFERALRHDPSDYAGSDVDVVNTTESAWSTEEEEESFERRNPIVVPDDHPIAYRDANPFVDSDEEDVGVRVRHLNYNHFPPQYRPALTLTLPQNLPELRRGQVLVIPIRMSMQIVHPDDILDL